MISAADAPSVRKDALPESRLYAFLEWITGSHGAVGFDEGGFQRAQLVQRRRANAVVGLDELLLPGHEHPHHVRQQPGFRGLGNM